MSAPKEMHAAQDKEHVQYDGVAEPLDVVAAALSLPQPPSTSIIRLASTSVNIFFIAHPSIMRDYFASSA